MTVFTREAWGEFRVPVLDLTNLLSTQRAGSTSMSFGEAVVRSSKLAGTPVSSDGLVNRSSGVELPLSDGEGGKGLQSLRVIRCLPVTWQCGALREQASDKPRGRKPRAGVGRTVRRAGAMGI